MKDFVGFTTPTSERGFSATFNAIRGAEDLNNNKLHYFQKSFESLTNKNLINYNENDLENELNSSVKMCLRSDRKTAVLLSGGIDSSLISCIAKNYSSNLGNNICQTSLKTKKAHI